MINNRQAGRRRGRGNNNNGGGGGQRQGGGGGGGRPDTGNRIDSRARGNASQLYEKYKTLARDAQMQGDRVNIEYYLQFADHYFRVLSEQRSRFEESQPQQQQQPRRQQPFDIDGDDDYGDEGEPIRQGEQQGQSDGNRQDGRQDARQANGNGQDREERQPRYEQHGDGQRDGQRGETQQRPARNRDDYRDVQGRDVQARESQARDTQNGQAREPREERPRAEYGDTQPRELPRRAPRAAVAQPVEADQGYQRAAVTPANDAADAQPAQDEQPRRRGRPRRDRSAGDGAPVEAAPAALDADRLPPSLGISASAKPVAVEGEGKPRRRRIRAAETDEATQTG